MFPLIKNESRGTEREWRGLSRIPERDLEEYGGFPTRAQRGSDLGLGFLIVETTRSGPRGESHLTGQEKALDLTGTGCCVAYQIGNVMSRR